MLILLRTLLVVISFVYPLYAIAQNTLLIDSAIENITAQILTFPQEKLYVQTDKQCYIAGEKLWFRIFLLNSCLHTPMSASRYVYIELIDPFNVVVDRLRIRPEHGLFHNAFELPTSLTQGSYRLRAYTRYMENVGDNFFFSRSVYVIRQSPDNIKMDIKLEAIDETHIGVELTFNNSKTKEILTPKAVKVIFNNDKAIVYKAKTDGTVMFELDLKHVDAKRTIYVEFIDDNNKIVFSEFATLPFLEVPSIELTFYPEGGNIIEGITNRISFKGLYRNGSPANIVGAVFDSDEKEVATLQTVHDGMGEFNYFPESGKEYYVKYKSDTKTITMKLPIAQSEALSLSATWRNDKLWLTVKYKPGQSLPNLLLLAHCRGDVQFLHEWNGEVNHLILDKKSLKSGVTHFILLNEHYEPVSERLVFCLNYDNASAVINTDKPKYQKREPVRTEIVLSNYSSSYNDSHKPNFSVSITDDKIVPLDTTTNILAEILITSELKGNIVFPAYYLNSSIEATKAADILMMTHGWTRYDIPKAMRGEFIVPKIQFEQSQSFSGRVIGGLKGKELENMNVTLLYYNDSINVFSNAVTNADGKYYFENMEFPDTASLIFQALKQNGKKAFSMDLQPDPIVFPKVTEATSSSLYLHKANFQSYIDNLDFLYSFDEDVRLIILPDIVIRPKIQKGKYRNSRGACPDFFLSDEDIQLNGLSDMKSILALNPNIKIRGNYITARFSATKDIVSTPPQGWFPVCFYINGTLFNEEDHEDIIKLINTNEIAEFDLINTVTKLYAYYQMDALSNPSKADINRLSEEENEFSKRQNLKKKSFDPINEVTYGSESMRPIIEIITKNGILPELRPRTFNIKVVNSGGYKPAIEFYSPRYDTPEARSSDNPDLRSTIYWKPDVLADENGKASIEFYTADTPTTYSVVIEGVCPDGTLIYKRCNGLVTVK
jgi:hypothetical protein